MNRDSKDNSSLHNKLESYCSSDYLPMHMPGHKRNPDVSLSSYGTDITEIDDFDNLHNPNGVIRELADKAASIWNADNCILSVNGSTGLIVSAIIALASRGSILIASNCHISVWHGIELSGAHAYILDVPFMKSINSSFVSDTLNQHPDIKSVIITSPTYEGTVSNIKSIYDVCHENDVLLTVDEAHGAHLGLNDYFPASSYADIVIKSIHKTLNAPTQTALLLIYGNKAPYRLINHYVGSTESTSPSYVLMSGISKCINTISTSNALDEWVAGIKSARAKLTSLTSLSLNNSDDPSKFVIMCNGSISGFELARLLREKYKIELEAAFPTYIIAMSGIGDTYSSLDRFTEAILEIDANLTPNPANKPDEITIYNQLQEVSGADIKAAIISTTSEVDIDKCLGMASACYAFAYPPGVPLLVPGQEISTNVIKHLRTLENQGVHINMEPSCERGKLLVVDTN